MKIDGNSKEEILPGTYEMIRKMEIKSNNVRSLYVPKHLEEICIVILGKPSRLFLICTLSCWQLSMCLNKAKYSLSAHLCGLTRKGNQMTFIAGIVCTLLFILCMHIINSLHNERYIFF